MRYASLTLTKSLLLLAVAACVSGCGHKGALVAPLSASISVAQHHLT